MKTPQKLNPVYPFQGKKTFFWKTLFYQFFLLLDLYFYADFKKKFDEQIRRKVIHRRADGHTDGRTNKHEFIRPPISGV